MLCLSDFELYSPGALHLFSQCKPIAFMPFSLPSPSSLLKLPSITFATWGGGGGGGGGTGGSSSTQPYAKSYSDYPK